MAVDPGAHLFALPPGVDFPRELVAGLIERFADRPPEAMARARLYLNSGRMRRRVRECFLENGARYLPQLLLISDLGADPLAGLPMPVPSLRRKLELTRLVEELTRRLPEFEAGSSHFALAESLASLMAEMQSEGVHPERLDRLEIAETHARHWQQSLAFIRIIARYFESDGELDAEARQRLVVETLAQTWRDAPPADPVIVAGSTGSRGATALFMRLVAHLPEGMVVLPGFDRDMTEKAWNSLDSSLFPIEDHPQYRFLALLRSLDLAPETVQDWRAIAAPDPARNRLVSLALRPAPVTDQWREEGGSLGDLETACAGLSLITARDPREEALAIALALREAAERQVQAALITPDRLLARRVAAALDRWGIVPDDSAGQPLQQTAPGRLLRQLAQISGQRLPIAELMILLKHPLTATGAGGEARGRHLRNTRELELFLRRNGPAFPDADALAVWAAKSPEDRETWAEWLAGILSQIVAPLPDQLPPRVEAHLALCEAIAAGPGGDPAASELWREAGGREALRLMSDLREQAGHAGEVSASDYADLVNRHLQGGMVRQTLTSHPLIAIWGTLEARAQGAKLVICGGLNEGSWPEAPAPDPWLSRQMRLEAGLLLPERQIGLSSHDFQQAVAAPQVILSRAGRDAEAQTIPSRWLNRLLNLIKGLPEQNGVAALKAMEARGQRWIDLAQELERPKISLTPAPRPSPNPPVEDRPRELPVTAIQTLIRDPYAIYARRVLRLRPLDPLRPEPDPLLRGQVLHEIVETFVKTHVEGETLDCARARLLTITQEVLETKIPWPSTQRIWFARIHGIAEKFCRDEEERRAKGTPAVIEKKGSIPLQKVNFMLSAKPDRIDILEDGSAEIFDYKTGKPPGDAEVLAFNKQMLLEAAMVSRGAFEQIGPRDVSAMTYIRLGGDGETRTMGQTIKVKDREETPEDSWVKLEELIARYLRPSQGFTARRAMQKARDISDYDQLSRFGEWDITDTPPKEGSA
ncbi:double-strand break repair protein AddB [Thioclava sp. L04-15]|uniref:double-strand break repair protein AddB n=1 Tax=Thioclava sp. L04-15 TaxID=1915318 RepID=UPI00099783F0|nr:double-strand break repair protein AddB [Thioclava sp. L04-15]OOY29524.1 double-strand break repair protein AddB [Thioclava sp. L04-15]TNE94382.1 MAG: double-strand break repair protein AddB [Paracoccaceae bacterium]